jgi:hypothetical protein
LLIPLLIPLVNSPLRIIKIPIVINPKTIFWGYSISRVAC